nr:unnamed protein product [Digitaria exilis]
MAFAAEGMERSVAGTPAASMRRNASKAEPGRPFWEKEDMRDDHAAGEGGHGRSRKARWERPGSAQRAGSGGGEVAVELLPLGERARGGERDEDLGQRAREGRQRRAGRR